MASSTGTSNRILIVGGGISGLAVAVRLAQASLPVTVLEGTSLGFGASTRNQGWLQSGAWFAPESLELARWCHESLQQTLKFCPEALEEHCEQMIYLIEADETDPAHWTNAWEQAGIPFQALTTEALFQRFPGLAINRSRAAYELPDRAVRMDLLLAKLAETARQAGAEIRPNTVVARLIQQDNNVQGVETVASESIQAGLVILAGNARGGFLFPGFGTETVGSQQETTLVTLKSHLVAVRPAIGHTPLCVVDSGGFNHIPHPPISVFGSNRWVPVSPTEDEQTNTAELELIWDRVKHFFPDFHRREHDVLEWAGTTVQAMHVDQILPGRVPLPTVVNHEQESPSVRNLLSLFAGRATLWPHLAEQTLHAVLQMRESSESRIASPPWGTLLPSRNPFS